MCFPVDFAKFLRTLFLQKTSRRLLLEFQLFCFFYGDLYRRFYVLLSSERKAGNLIYKIEIWLLLQFLWLEISSKELYLEVCLNVN